jgi:phosphoribosyl 1,2-cyclic phosphate phosphodiesterase
MKLIFLGTGTSTGVPQIGCKCSVCNSADIRDKRLRASVLIADGDNQIIIDCGPDLRQQLLVHDIDRLSAVLLTHSHYDHIAGLDDLRPLGVAHIYAEKNVLDVIHQNMPYCFGDLRYPGVPTLQLNEITEDEFSIGKTLVKPIRIMHAMLPILGFRIGNIAYLTDVKTIDDKAFEQLRNLDVLILNALRPKKHMSHLSLDEALEIATRIGAAETYFIHMNHDMGLHAEVNKLLPDHVQLAYDGLELFSDK